MNQLSLLLQNSSGQLAVGIAQGETLLFDSTEHADLAGSKNILEHIRFARSQTGRSLDDIGRVFVDIGPGGLGATRTTVAFANAYGYARDIPVIGINAFDLIGFHVARETGQPVVCIRPAARPNFYVGIYKNAELSDFTLIDKDKVLELIRANQGQAAFAGKLPADPDPEMQEVPFPTSHGNTASMASFLLRATQDETFNAGTKRVYPITDNLDTKHI